MWMNLSVCNVLSVTSHHTHVASSAPDASLADSRLSNLTFGARSLFTTRTVRVVTNEGAYRSFIC